VAARSQGAGDGLDSRRVEHRRFCEEGLPRWPTFAVKERKYLAFTDDGAVVKSGLRREFCEVFMEHLKVGARRETVPQQRP